MDSTQLAVVASAVLSLLFSYTPGLSGWYDNQTSQVKALVMLLLLVIVTAGSFALSCYSPYSYFECNDAGFWAAAEVFVAAVAANQGVYLVTKNIGKAAIEPA